MEGEERGKRKENKSRGPEMLLEPLTPPPVPASSEGGVGKGGEKTIKNCSQPQETTTLAVGSLARGGRHWPK